MSGLPCLNRKGGGGFGEPDGLCMQLCLPGGFWVVSGWFQPLGTLWDPQSWEVLNFEGPSVLGPAHCVCCRDCFRAFYTHKFRAVLGKNRVIFPGEKVTPRSHLGWGASWRAPCL